MATYKILDSEGKIVNLIEADSEFANSIGAILADPNDKIEVDSFNHPQVKKIFTKLEVMSRFTNDELVRIYTEAKTNVAVEIWLDMFKVASEIDPRDERTVSGFAMLESLGLLNPGRSSEILTS